jgi:UDP-glucose 4-epimerase
MLHYGMKKKILITGSSGYIGSHLCKMLMPRYRVHGLDLLTPKIKIDEFHRQDITHLSGLKDHYDAVVHLAALVNVGESERIPGQYYKTNINGTRKVLRRITADNFVFASTGAAESGASAYGRSKRVAEDIVREECDQKRAWTTFRFYNVIGSTAVPPTNPDGLMYNLMQAPERGRFTVFGNDYNTPDRTAVRDYVHVNEICTAIAQAIEEPANGLENLGHGRGHSVLEMAEIYRRVNGVEFDIEYAPRRAGDMESSVLDNPSRYMQQLYTITELLKV